MVLRVAVMYTWQLLYLEVAVLIFYGTSAGSPGQILQDVGALAQLCQLLEAGKKRHGGHDADLWHLPPAAYNTAFRSLLTLNASITFTAALAKARDWQIAPLRNVTTTCHHLQLPQLPPS